MDGCPTLRPFSSQDVLSACQLCRRGSAGKQCAPPGKAHHVSLYTGSVNLVCQWTSRTKSFYLVGFDYSPSPNTTDLAIELHASEQGLSEANNNMGHHMHHLQEARN